MKQSTLLVFAVSAALLGLMASSQGVAEAQNRDRTGAFRAGAPAPGRRCLLHWELSIKFFVYVAPPQGALPAGAAARYVGPFLHENLDARIATSARKLRLSAEADVRKWATRTLAKVEQDDRCLDLRAHSALRGFVFYDRAAPESSVLSSDHAKGWVARRIDDVRAVVPADTRA